MRFLAIVCLCLLPLCIDSVTNKYSSGCTVDQCDSSNPYGGCSDANPCFRFETSKNKTLCAPQVDCSLFDACTASKGCASNTSVCVINSCCSAPICMPTALSSACSRSGSGSRSSTFGDVCVNAMWSDIEEVVNTSSYMMYSGSATDFVIDSKNNFYLSYNSNYNIIKYSANDTSSYKVVAYTYSMNNYASNKFFVDDNGAVYSAESWTGYGSNGYNTYYRVVKYVEEGNGTNTTVLFGDVTCGQQLNQICQCNGLFVDNKGAIYYTDASNYRVVLITPFSTTVTIVAGTTGYSGSATNQLNNPNGIYVDANNTLYVADSGNNRVVMWPANNANGGNGTNGTVLFTTGSSHTPYQLTLDKAGNVYISGSNSIYRFMRSVGVLKSIVTSVGSGMYSTPKVQLDTAGNIYTSSYGMYSYNNYLWRFRFISNGC